jgi:hypothetical protein
MKKLFAALGLFAGALLVVDWAAPKHDLRAFEPVAVAELETEMWRSYYEKHQVVLFGQLITLLRQQFGMPPLEAVVNAYRAAHAAFVFKDGKSRADYEQALPDLERYYAAISARATQAFDVKKVARLELEWWILHRERSPQLGASLADLQAAIYAVPAARFAEHARLRAEAMVLRDDRNTAITDADWAQIHRMLDDSWASLRGAL